MRSAFFGFHVASSALFTARANINVASHNMANAEITGFSRQVAQARANTPLNLNDQRGMYGTGSQVTGITQIRNQFLDKKFWHQRSILGEHTAVNTHLTFVETVFNNLQDAGLLRTFNGFFGTMYDLVGNAEAATFRTNVITNAASMAELVQHQARALQRQQMDVNQEVADVVNIINSLGAQISRLNEQIHIFERDGSNANDLRDQRALLIDELSKLINITVTERDFSQPGIPNDTRLSIVIDGMPFISHRDYNRLELVPREAADRRNSMDVDGLYDIRFANGTHLNIHGRSMQGVLKGLINVRDGNHNQVTGSFDAEPVVYSNPFSFEFAGQWGFVGGEFCFYVRKLDADGTLASLTLDAPGTIVINGQSFDITGCCSALSTPRSVRRIHIAMTPAELAALGPPASWDIDFPCVDDGEDRQGYRMVEIPGQPTNNFKGIPFYMNQLNELVRTFARAINEGKNANLERIPGTVGHINGFDDTPPSGRNQETMFFTFLDPNGNPVDINTAGMRKWMLPGGEFSAEAHHPDNVLRDSLGNPMFTLDYRQMNALNFVVNPELIRDPRLLAASSDNNIGQANNDVILGFVTIGNDRSLFREGSITDFIIAVSNHLAVDTQQANQFQVSFTEITTQTENHRISVSGVDTDEEMMNLVRFQSMFVSASRLINVLDTIYDTLINRLGNM